MSIPTNLRRTLAGLGAALVLSGTLASCSDSDENDDAPLNPIEWTAKKNAVRIAEYCPDSFDAEKIAENRQSVIREAVEQCDLDTDSAVSLCFDIHGEIPTGDRGYRDFRTPLEWCQSLYGTQEEMNQAQVGRQIQERENAKLDEQLRAAQAQEDARGDCQDVLSQATKLWTTEHDAMTVEEFCAWTNPTTDNWTAQ